MKLTKVGPTPFTRDTFLATRFILVGAHDEEQLEGFIHYLAQAPFTAGRVVYRLNPAVSRSAWEKEQLDHCVQSGGVLIMDAQCSTADAETFNYFFDEDHPDSHKDLNIIAVGVWQNISDLSKRFSPAFYDRFGYKIRLPQDQVFAKPDWLATHEPSPTDIIIDLGFADVSDCQRVLLKQIQLEAKTGKRMVTDGALPTLNATGKPQHVSLANIEEEGNLDMMPFLRSLFLPGQFPHLKFSIAPIDEKAWQKKVADLGHTCAIIPAEQISRLPQPCLVTYSTAYLLFGLPKSELGDDGVRFWTEAPGYLAKLTESDPPDPLIITENLSKEDWARLLSYSIKPLTIYLSNKVRDMMDLPSLVAGCFSRTIHIPFTTLPATLPTVIVTETPDQTAQAQVESKKEAIIHTSPADNAGAQICSYDAEKNPKVQPLGEALLAGKPISIVQPLSSLAFLISGWVPYNGELKKVSTHPVKFFMTPSECGMMPWVLFPQKSVEKPRLPTVIKEKKVDSQDVAQEATFKKALVDHPLLVVDGAAATEKMPFYLDHADIAPLLHPVTSVIMDPTTAFTQILNNILEWAALADDRYAVLVIYQAGCVKPGFFNCFKSLRQDNLSLILPHYGQVNLSPKHRVVFVDSLFDTSDNFFKKYCHAITCLPFSEDELQSDFIKPDCKGLEPEQSADIQQLFKAIHQARRQLGFNTLLTSIDIRAIFSRFHALMAQSPTPAWHQALQRSVAAIIGGTIVEASAKQAFLQWLRQRLPWAEWQDPETQALLEKLQKREGFVATPATMELARIYIDILIELRHWQKQDKCPPGYVGFTVPGPTCSGKDFTLNHVFELFGQKITRFNAGADLASGLKKLEAALKAGDPFIVSELDLWPKQTVNSLLLRLRHGKAEPGFRFGATINGSYASRQAFSSEFVQVYRHTGSLRGIVKSGIAPADHKELVRVFDALEAAFPSEPPPPSERSWNNMVEQVRLGASVQEAVTRNLTPHLLLLDTVDTVQPAPPEIKKDLFTETVQDYLKLNSAGFTVSWDEYSPIIGRSVKNTFHFPRPEPAAEAEFFDYLLVRITAAGLPLAVTPHKPLMNSLIWLRAVLVIQKTHPGCHKIPPYWTQQEAELRECIEQKRFPLPAFAHFHSLCITVLKMGFYLRYNRSDWQEYLSYSNELNHAINWLFSQWDRLNEWFMEPPQIKTLERILTAINLPHQTAVRSTAVSPIVSTERKSQAQSPASPIVPSSALRGQSALVTPTKTDPHRPFTFTPIVDGRSGIFDKSPKIQIGTTTLASGYLLPTVTYPHKNGYFDMPNGWFRAVFPKGEFFDDSRAAGENKGTITLTNPQPAEDGRYYLPLPFGTRAEIISITPDIPFKQGDDSQKGSYFNVHHREKTPPKLTAVTYYVQAPLTPRQLKVTQPYKQSRRFIKVDNIKSEKLKKFIIDLDRVDEQDSKAFITAIRRLETLFSEEIFYLDRENELSAKARLIAALADPAEFPNHFFAEGTGVCFEIAWGFAQVILDRLHSSPHSKYTVRLVHCFPIRHGKIFSIPHSITQVHHIDHGWLSFDPACQRRKPQARISSSSLPIALPDAKHDNVIDYQPVDAVLEFCYQTFSARLDSDILPMLTAQYLTSNKSSESTLPIGPLIIASGLFKSRNNLGSTDHPQALLLSLPAIGKPDNGDLQILWEYLLPKDYSVTVYIHDDKTKEDKFAVAANATHIARLLTLAKPASAAQANAWKKYQMDMGRSGLVVDAVRYERLKTTFSTIYREIVQDHKQIAAWEQKTDLSHFRKRDVLGLMRTDFSPTESKGGEIVFFRELTSEDLAAILEKNPSDITIQGSVLTAPLVLKIPANCMVHISNTFVSQKFIDFLINEDTEITSLRFDGCSFDASIHIPANDRLHIITFSSCKGKLPHFSNNNQLISITISSCEAKFLDENSINAILKVCCRCIYLRIEDPLKTPLKIKKLIIPRESWLISLQLDTIGSIDYLRIDNGLARVKGRSLESIEVANYSSLVLMLPRRRMEDGAWYRIDNTLYSAHSPQEKLLLEGSSPPGCTAHHKEAVATSFTYIKETLEHLKAHWIRLHKHAPQSIQAAEVEDRINWLSAGLTKEFAKTKIAETSTASTHPAPS